MEKGKGIAALIIGKPHDEEEEHDDEGDMAEDVASEDVMAAVHAKDAGALKDALRSFVKACLASRDKGSEEPDGDEY